MATLSRRAQHALAALIAYRRAKGESMEGAHPDDRKSEISDLVADLLHYAAGEGHDLKSILFCAESNAGAELAGLAD